MQPAAPADENVPPPGASAAGKRTRQRPAAEPSRARRALNELTNRGPPVRGKVAAKSTSSRRRKHARRPAKVEEIITPLSACKVGADAPVTPATPVPQLPAGVQDIDADDVVAGDHLSEPAVAHLVHTNLRLRERRFMADANYLDRQSDITARMRSILVDWLVDVHAKFKLVPETLHLTINIIDRFLSSAHVSRRRLQLVGVASMLIAAKYEEIYGPEVADFVYISAHAYSKQEILDMEITILNRLEFRITTPSARAFLARALKAAAHTLPAADAPAARHLAAYCVELALQDAGMLQFALSERAAAAVSVAARAVGARVPWCAHMKFHCGDVAQDTLAACEDALLELLEAQRDPVGTNKLTGLKRKFADVRYLEVSPLTPAAESRVVHPSSPVAPMHDD